MQRLRLAKSLNESFAGIAKANGQEQTEDRMIDAFVLTCVALRRRAEENGVPDLGLQP